MYLLLYIYIYIYIYTYIHINTHVHIHTHIHTHTCRELHMVILQPFVCQSHFSHCIYSCCLAYSSKLSFIRPNSEFWKESFCLCRSKHLAQSINNSQIHFYYSFKLRIFFHTIRFAYRKMKDAKKIGCFHDVKNERNFLRWVGYSRILTCSSMGMNWHTDIKKKSYLKNKPGKLW